MLRRKKSIRIGAENEGIGRGGCGHRMEKVDRLRGRWRKGKHGLAVVRPDGTGATFLAELMDTNAPLPVDGHEHNVVTGWKTDCVCFGDAGPGNERCERQIRNCDYARYIA